MIGRLPATPAGPTGPGGSGVGIVGLVRLAVTAFTVATVQAELIDATDAVLLRHLDLPLAVAIALIIVRPNDAALVGPVFGLVVDAFGQRLFGIHALAFAMIGPVVAAVPVARLRTRLSALAWLAAVPALVVTAVVAGARSLVDGGLTVGLGARMFQTAAWAIVVALPLTSLLGTRIGPAVRLREPGSGPARRRDRTGRARSRRRRRIGPMAPVGPRAGSARW